MIDAVTVTLLAAGLVAISVSFYMMVLERRRRKEDRRVGFYNRDGGGKFTAGDVSKEVPTNKKTEK